MTVGTLQRKQKNRKWLSKAVDSGPDRLAFEVENLQSENNHRHDEDTTKDLGFHHLEMVDERREKQHSPQDTDSRENSSTEPCTVPECKETHRSEHGDEGERRERRNPLQTPVGGECSRNHSQHHEWSRRNPLSSRTRKSTRTPAAVTPNVNAFRRSW